jgi:hypothetical protein
MTAQEVLTQVRERGVALAVIDGRLKGSPPGLLSQDLKTAIRDRAAEIKALLPPSGHGAWSIIETCRAHGVALLIDPENGDLVIGRPGAKADETTQPWPSLLTAIEANLDAVVRLVELGWALRVAIPRQVAA